MHTIRRKKKQSRSPFHWRRALLEQLEPRLMLTGDVSQLLLFGSDKVDVGENVNLDGIVGSNKEIKLKNDSIAGGLYAAGEVRHAKVKLDRSVLINVDVLANGKVEIDKDALVPGSI